MYVYMHCHVQLNKATQEEHVKMKKNPKHTVMLDFRSKIPESWRDDRKH